jgi:uncharacterized membrane protein YfcA
MRATYFNLYIAVVGIGISAIFGIYGNLNRIPITIILSISGLIYIMSLLSIMRSERWGGHIIHDLRAVRKIQNHYSSKNKAIRDIIPLNPKPMSSFEFDRPLWDRNRSIETPAMIIGSIMSALLIGYFLSPPYNWILAFLLIILPILVWRAEVNNLLRRHAKCCLSLSQEEARMSILIKEKS